MNIIKLLIVLLCCYNTIAAQFSNGDGTESSPYQITTVIELDSIKNHCDKYFILMNDLDFEGTVFDSSQSVDNEGWYPIGDSETPFTGSFNGNNKEIKNLYIHRPTVVYLGLFGYANDHAKIYGINLKDITITGNSDIGGIVGYTENEVFIYNCLVSGTITGVDDLGGIIGYSYGILTNRKALIYNCGSLVSFYKLESSLYDVQVHAHHLQAPASVMRPCPLWRTFI